MSVGIVGCNEIPPADVPFPGRVNVDGGAIDFDRMGEDASDVGDGGVACDVNRGSMQRDSDALP